MPKPKTVKQAAASNDNPVANMAGVDALGAR
jgi:hypothetical protein